MWRKALTALAVVVPLLISLGLEREARRREGVAEKREAELLRLQNDQAELQGLRRRLRAAGRAQELRLSLAPWQQRQRRLLSALKAQPWTALEWEEAGFYLEGPGVDGLPWPGSQKQPGRMTGRWK